MGITLTGRMSGFQKMMLWLCGCGFCSSHAKLTHCLPKKYQKCHFHFFSYFLKYAIQTPIKLPNTDLCHVRDFQAYKSRQLKYFGTLYGRQYTKNLRFFLNFLEYALPIPTVHRHMDLLHTINLQAYK